jgi:hypothetical protein
MRKLLIAAVLVAQAASFAAPAQAADLSAGLQQPENRMGAFAGARLRIALGDTRQERVRVGLAIAPTLHRISDGNARMRIGEGLEYGFTERRTPAVSLAGLRVGDMQRGPGGARRNVSTVGWVAIGVGTVVVAGAIAVGWLVHEASQNTE